MTISDRHGSVVRAAVTTATKRAFEGKPLDWKRRHCGHLMEHQARLLGHGEALDRYADILAVGACTTERGAMRLLKRKSHADTADWLDALGLERLPAAAQRLIGDVVGWREPGHHLTALAIYIGNGAVIGFQADLGVCCAVRPDWSNPDVPPVAWRL